MGAFIVRQSFKKLPAKPVVLIESLIPSYAGENGIGGNGEDEKEKPPVIY